MKVGDTVFIFDPNHRVYRKDAEGHSRGGPIYREHFVKRAIVGETSRSWLVGLKAEFPSDHWSTTKHSKKDPKNRLFTLEQVEEEVYVTEHRYKIVRLVEHSDYKTLKAVADLVGYKENVK